MNRIYQSAEGISTVFQKVLDGNTAALSGEIPSSYLDQIREWVKRTPSAHRGGANDPTANLKATAANLKATAANQMGISIDNYAQMKQSLGSASTSEEGPYDPKKASGIDEGYMAAVNKINQINDSMNRFASQYGILKLEKESDIETDLRLIPGPVASVIASGVSQVGIPAADTKAFLDKIKVPFRLIVTGIYLFLDVTRVIVSVQGEESKRQTLTLLVALFEFLRGDWQKALLSFMGYYGEAPLMFGQFAKIYLTMFRTLSPTLQQQITFGALDVTKSFLIGILLAIFKIAAPEEVRLPLITVLRQIAEKKAAVNGTLVQAGLPPREGYFSPTFEDLNHLQSLMDDPDFVCSCEYADLIKQVDRSPLIHIVLELMRIEVNQEHRERYRCPPPCKPFVSSLVSTGLSAKSTTSSTDTNASPSPNGPLKEPNASPSPNGPKESNGPLKEPNGPLKEPNGPLKESNGPLKEPNVAKGPKESNAPNGPKESNASKEIQAMVGGGPSYVPRTIRHPRRIQTIHHTTQRGSKRGTIKLSSRR